MSKTQRKLRVGVTQWHATPDIQRNLDTATRLITLAAEDGATLVVLPENGLMLGTNTEMRAAAFSESSPELLLLRELARQHEIALIIGGMKYRVADEVYNSALIIGPDGEIQGRYDKLHLFNANVGGQSFEASSVEKAGSHLVLVEIEGVRVGVTICYDIRFPELARQLASEGAEILLVPAAFVKSTGEAHWHTLLRARAIENHTFVLAPATVHSPNADYADAFPTYGHALAVNPWGEVLFDLGTSGEAVEVIDINLDEVTQARRKLPVLEQRRTPEIYQSTPKTVRIPEVTRASVEHSAIRS